MLVANPVLLVTGEQSPCDSTGADHDEGAATDGSVGTQVRQRHRDGTANDRASAAGDHVQLATDAGDADDAGIARRRAGGDVGAAAAQQRQPLGATVDGGGAPARGSASEVAARGSRTGRRRRRPARRCGGAQQEHSVLVHGWLSDAPQPAAPHVAAAHRPPAAVAHAHCRRPRRRRRLRPGIVPFFSPSYFEKDPMQQKYAQIDRSSLHLVKVQTVELK